VVNIPLAEPTNIRVLHISHIEDHLRILKVRLFAALHNERVRELFCFVHNPLGYIFTREILL